MYNYKKVLEVLEHYKNKLTDIKIESITGISKSTCNKWKNNYYNNYENLHKRYNKQHINLENKFINSIENEIFNYIKNIVKDNPFTTYSFFISLIIVFKQILWIYFRFFELEIFKICKIFYLYIFFI
jgi:hypothetical protein